MCFFVRHVWRTCFKQVRIVLVTFDELFLEVFFVCYVWRTRFKQVRLVLVTCDKLVSNKSGLCLSRVTNFFWMCFFVRHVWRTCQACVGHVWQTFYGGVFLFVTCDKLFLDVFFCFLSCLCSSHVTNSFVSFRVCVRHVWRTRLKTLVRLFVTCDELFLDVFFCSSRVTNLLSLCCSRVTNFFWRCFFVRHVW